MVPSLNLEYISRLDLHSPWKVKLDDGDMGGLEYNHPVPVRRARHEFEVKRVRIQRCLTEAFHDIIDLYTDEGERQDVESRRYITVIDAQEKKFKFDDEHEWTFEQASESYLYMLDDDMEHVKALVECARGFSDMGYAIDGFENQGVQSEDSASDEAGVPEDSEDDLVILE